MYSHNLRLRNNTELAQNKDVVFFNRVPKTGSQMMQEMAKILAIENNFTTFIDPTPLALFPPETEQDKFSRNWRKKLNKPGIYFRHVPWMNFTSLSVPNPVWVSMVRDPIDRVLSWFYYIRWKNRPDDDNAEDCATSQEMKEFCKTFNQLRGREQTKPFSWYEMDFESCVRMEEAECRFESGQGGWKDWDLTYDPYTGNEIYALTGPMYEDYRSQVMFFCGNEPDCIEFNSIRALKKAKAVVDENFSVVGILEDLDGTFQALEKYVPRYFSNVANRYKKAKEDTKTKNYNPNRKKISMGLRKTLEKKFASEFEFYDFCKQRLHLQLKKISEMADDKTKEKDVEANIAHDDVNQKRNFVLL